MPRSAVIRYMTVRRTRLRTATAGEGRSYCEEALFTPPDNGVRRNPVVLIGLPPLPSRLRAAAAAAACNCSVASCPRLTASPGMPAYGEETPAPIGCQKDAPGALIKFEYQRRVQLAVRCHSRSAINSAPCCFCAANCSRRVGCSGSTAFNPLLSALPSLRTVLQHTPKPRLKRVHVCSWGTGQRQLPVANRQSLLSDAGLQPHGPLCSRGQSPIIASITSHGSTRLQES